MTPFHHLLINNLIANITNFTVWFAVTFWVFLETKSVFATGMIAGMYLVLTAAFAIWFGSLVDHHRKTRVMMVSSAASLLLYTLALAGYFIAPEGSISRISAAPLWLFLFAVMLGVIAGNLRNIALPTYRLAITPHTSFGSCSNSSGPGCSPNC